MTDSGKDGKTLDCHKCFQDIPWNLYNEALKTLNKQFYTYRAGHINAVELGRGDELQTVNIYHQSKKIAIHEAGHVMAVWYGGSMNSVKRATIKYQWSHYHEPHLHTTPLRKYPLQTQADFFEELCFCLSGRIAESMFFPEEQANFPSFLNFERSDIHKAVNIAYYMYRNESGIKKDAEEDPEYIKFIRTDVLEDISCYLIRGYEATTELLETRAKQLLKVALELLEKQTLNLDYLLTLLGRPKKRKISLYDKFCAFSMELRPLAKKRYCLTKPRRLKKTKKRKSNATKRKKSKGLAKRSEKKQDTILRQKKEKTNGPSRKRKRKDSTCTSKKRKTNDGQVMSVFN